MKKSLILVLIAFAFSTAAYGQGVPKPPVYIATDNVTTIGQVTDVTSKDEYYLHLKALIESHKVQSLTHQYKYNGTFKLNSADLSSMSSNGQVAMMSVARQRGMEPTAYKALFGKICTTPTETNGVLTEAVVVDHLKCRFGLAEMKNSTPTNVVTKGRLAMLLNQALNLWMRKLDALK